MTAFAVLKLARDAPFARQMINAGLSTATTYQTPLSTPDVDSESRVDCEVHVRANFLAFVPTGARARLGQTCLSIRLCRLLARLA